MPHKCLNRCDDETTVGDDLEIATPTHRHRPDPPPYHPRPSFCPTYLYLATTVEPYILCPVWVTGINPQDFHHVQAHHLPINCSWRASRSEWSVFALFPIRTINMVASTQTCTPGSPGCACVHTATPGNPRRRNMRGDLIKHMHVTRACRSHLVAQSPRCALKGLDQAGEEHRT